MSSNPWIKHAKKYTATHKVSYKQGLIDARKSYYGKEEPKKKKKPATKTKEETKMDLSKVPVGLKNKILALGIKK